MTAATNPLQDATAKLSTGMIADSITMMFREHPDSRMTGDERMVYRHLCEEYEARVGEDAFDAFFDALEG